MDVDKCILHDVYIDVLSQLLVSIHDVLLEQDLSLIAVKCLLLSEDPSLHERAVLILRQQTEVC